MSEDDLFYKDILFPGVIKNYILFLYLKYFIGGTQLSLVGISEYKGQLEGGQLDKRTLIFFSCEAY